MNADRYEYATNKNFLNYLFESIGPKGRIKKAVVFDVLSIDGVTYFNLGFGDWNEKQQKIDDLVISNNQDRDKVLATVAATVLDFTSIYPDMMVYAQGSTPARTRLYQMGISANIDEIASVLHVYGNTKGKWLPFKKNVNYDAFFVLRKKR